MTHKGDNNELNPKLTLKGKYGHFFLGIQNSEYRKQYESVFFFVVAINCFMMLVMTQLIPACQELVPFLDFLFRPKLFTPCPKFTALKQALGLHLDVRVFDLFQQCAYLFLHGAMDSTLWQPLSGQGLTYSPGLWTSPHLSGLRPPRLPPTPNPVLCTASAACLAILTNPCSSLSSQRAAGPGRAWHYIRDSRYQSGKRSWC